MGFLWRRKKEWEADLERELRADLELEAEEQRERGLSADAAGDAARRSLGNATRIKEDVRAAWGLEWLGQMRQDLVYGFRLFARSPGFAAVALLTLTAGIGMVTAVFSVVNATLLRPLPYRDSARLVSIFEDHTDGSTGLLYDYDTPGGYSDLKKQTQLFQTIAAVDGVNEFALSGHGQPQRVSDAMVTWNLFPMLGVKAQLGRVFGPAEDRPGFQRVALLSDALWQSRFGADKGIIGREVWIDNRITVEKYTVIGIMPPHFAFPAANVDVWTPRAFTAEELNSHGEHYLHLVARLNPGVSLARANADLRVLAGRTRKVYEFERTLHRFIVEPLQESYTRDARRGLLLLLTAAGFILLIACANVANLLLSRSGVRQREMAMRTALGASRSRILRQLLTESVLLSAFGSALGTLLARGSFVFLRHLIPEDLSGAASLSLDLRLLGFVILLSVATSVTFGLAPAWRISRTDLNIVLREDTRGGIRQGILGYPLVAGEIALSLVLLVGAGLLLRSFVALSHVDPGFRADHVLAVGGFLKFPPADEHYAQRMQMFDQMLAKVRALPGVISAGFTSELPLGWAGGRAGFFPEGAPPRPDIPYAANDRVVTPGYFETLRIALLHGRFFDDHDRLSTAPVVIINRAMARRFWPHQDALGKRLKFGGLDSGGPWAQIVGIAGDLPITLNEPALPEMYFPAWQARGNYMTPHTLVLRTATQPGALAEAVRQAIWSVDPNQPLDNIFPLSEIIDEDLAPYGTQMMLIGVAAVLAVILACIGIYGVMEYLVAQRTREVGIRLALGAQRRDVLSLVLGKGARIAALGILIGLTGSALLTRLMAGFLYATSPADTLTYVVVCPLLFGIALIACFIPAHRAMRIEPLAALREQ